MNGPRRFHKQDIHTTTILKLLARIRAKPNRTEKLQDYVQK